MNQIVKKENSALANFAERFHVDPATMEHTLKTTVFKQKGNQPITNEQMVMLMVVADQYNLNPFTKEIYAFPDKGGIVPVIGVDGWSRLINSNPQFDGIEFNQSETMTQQGKGKSCPEWIECIIYRKDRSHPVKVKEYFDEVYRESNYPGPWQSHTKRMLRHKATIQCARLAFGFAGIYDEDEGERIVETNLDAIKEVEGEVIEADTKAEKIAAKLSKKKEPAKLELAVGEIAGEGADELMVSITKTETLDELNDLLESCQTFAKTDFIENIRECFKAQKKLLTMKAKK